MLGVVLAGAMLWIAATTPYVVHPSESVIVTYFGKPVATVTEPGFYLKLPLPFQRIMRVDLRLRLLRTRLIQELTRDKKSLLVRCMCLWRVSNPLRYMTTCGDTRRAEARLEDLVNSELGAVMGTYALEELLGEGGKRNLQTLRSRLTENCDRRSRSLYGMSVAFMALEELSLPEDNAKAVFERMKAERARDANRYRAEGEREASAIEARARRKRAEILANAEKEAQIIRAQGEARANALYAEAYKEDPLFFEFLRSMESYRRILGSNAYLILERGDETMKWFFSTPEKGEE